MSVFEKIYQTDPSREIENEYEKHTRIELSEREYCAKFIYKPPTEWEKIPHLKDKFKKAKKICEHT